MDEWKRERSKLDKEVAVVKQKIAQMTAPSYNRMCLRILLNDLLVRRHKLHAKILKQEDEEKLNEIFKNISGLSDEHVQRLMRDMERLKLVQV